jgi:O-methyltransferase involved in polyketide biosynthesis
VSSEPKIDGAMLTGVSETALLTLQVRATEARRPDAIIDDPMAIELVNAIDFDFAKFGYSAARTWRYAR